jgi:hypothetical protein
MVDPDAPTPENPDKAPIRHFLGGDFAFKEDGVSLVNNTAAVTEYKPPSPPKDRSHTGQSEDFYLVMYISDTDVI